MNQFLKKIKSFDIVVVLFCIVTAFIMLLGHKQLQGLAIHFVIRVLFLTIMFFLINAEESKNKTLLFFRNFYPLIFLGFFYSETDYYNNLLFENFDPVLMHLDKVLFNTQLSLEFSKLVSSRWFSELMHLGYFSYYMLIVSIPLLFYIKARGQFEKAMFIIILSFCFYYLIFILFPSIGPQFYFPVEQRHIPKGFLFHEIMSKVLLVGETQTGAFPSSHVGISVIILILMFKNFKNLFATILPLIIILIFSTVYIKAHYVIDILGGFITGFLFYYWSDKIYEELFLKNKTLVKL